MTVTWLVVGARLGRPLDSTPGQDSRGLMAVLQSYGGTRSAMDIDRSERASRASPLGPAMMRHHHGGYSMRTDEIQHFPVRLRAMCGNEYRSRTGRRWQG